MGFPNTDAGSSLGPLMTGFDAGFGRGCSPCGPGPGCLDCGSGCRCDRSNRPEPWVVPFSPAGDPGWKDSAGPLCAQLVQIRTAGVWSDGDGVYALASGLADHAFELPADLDGGVHGFDRGAAAQMTRVLYNDGHGWSQVTNIDGGSSTVQLTGIPPSTAVTFLPDPDAGQCVLNVITGGDAKCMRNANPGVTAVHAAGENHAYAIGGPTSSSLLEFDGTSWTQDPDPLPRPADALWAGGDELIAIGGNDVMRRHGDMPWTVEPLQTAELTALWATDANDVWLGTADGRVLHFDGGQWRELAQLGGLTCSGARPVEGLVGAGSHVWVYSDRQLARWNGEKLETFGNWSCLNSDTTDTIRAVSANAEDDVFVSVSGTTSVTSCGAAYVVHFDGTSFHRM